MRFASQWLFLAAFLSCIGAGASSVAQNCQEQYIPGVIEVGALEIDGRPRESAVTGNPREFAVSGNYVYYLDWHEILIVDISKRDDLHQVGSLQLDQARKIVAWGSWLLVLTAESRVLPVDISDPKNPVTYPALLDGQAVFDFVLDDDDLFMMAGDAGVVWLDASTLPASSLIDQKTISELTGNEYSYPARGAIDVGTAGLFLTSYYNQFEMDQVLIEVFPNESQGKAELVGGGLVQTGDGAQVVVGDDMVFLATPFRSGDYMSGVFGYRTVTHNATNLSEVLDVQSEWEEVEILYRPYSMKLMLVGERQIAKIRRDKTEIFDVSANGSWTVARYLTPYGNAAVRTGDGLVCIKGEWGRVSLVTLDIADFGEPSRLGASYDLTGTGRGIFARSPYIFKNVYHSDEFDDYEGTEVYLVGSEGALSYVNEYSDHTLWATDDYALISTGGYSNRQIVDIVTGDILWTGTGRFVSNECLNDSIGCVSNDAILEVYDLAVVPPALISTWQSNGQILLAHQLFRDRYCVWVFQTESGAEMVLLDLAVPEAPVVVSHLAGFWSFSETVSHVRINGDVVTISSSGHLPRTVCFDLTDPAYPRLISEYPYPGEVNGNVSVVVEGHRAMVYRVLSLDESQFLGEIYLDFMKSDWGVIGDYLVTYSSHDISTYRMPCVDEESNELLYFQWDDNSDRERLIWEFGGSRESEDIRLVAECGSGEEYIPFHKNDDGSWYAEISAYLGCQSAAQVRFHLMVRSDVVTWSVVGTLERPVARPLSSMVITGVAPNPSNQSSILAFTLPREMMIEVEVYDLSGRLVGNLYQGVLSAGDHRIGWDGTNGHGMNAPSGSYVFRLEGSGIVRTEKVTLVR